MSRDVIVMKITSKEPKRWGVSLTNDDLRSGLLDCPSFVQVDAIYSLLKNDHSRCDWNGRTGKNEGNKNTDF
jgi:hypothetical protein